MAERMDDLLVAWGLVGEALAKVDRRRMERLLELAVRTAEVHGADPGPLFASRHVDLDASADLC